MSMSTGYVRTHIYIEDMRTKKALSAWIPLVSVFCSSGAVVPIFLDIDARGGRKLRTDTHTHTRGTATVTITIKIIRSAEAQ